MVRKFRDADIRRVMELWLSGNLDAHPFISGEYWRSNFAAVRKQILQAEVYVYESGQEIAGFVGLVDGYIAGLFVASDCRSQGVGRELLNCAKEKYRELSLKVYRKNARAVSFYLREGFSISAEGVDEDTGEAEYAMLWSAERA